VVLLGILVESGLFWWGEMAFARREDPGKNQKHGQGGRGRGRVVPILPHVSQSSQESQVTVKHRCRAILERRCEARSPTNAATRSYMSVKFREHLLLKCILYF
jgi:hypothetical protein